MTNDGPCPRCGAEQCKRWLLLDGSDVCDECWLDVAMDRQTTHWRSSVAALPIQKPPQVATIYRRQTEVRYSLSTKQGESMSNQRGRPPKVPLHKWKAKLTELLKPGYNSICLLCGHVFYGASMSTCSRCGGLCHLYTDHALGLMGRNATIYIEAE